MKDGSKARNRGSAEALTPEVPGGMEERKYDRRGLMIPIGVGIAALVILIIGWLAAPGFLTTDNLLQIIRSGALIGIAALGTTFITISGNYFSLSIGQTAMFCAIAFDGTLSWGWGLGGALTATLALALVLGLIQGWLVAIGANPIISTLGAGVIIYGIAAIVTDLKVVRTGTNIAEWIGRGRPLGIPTQSWAFIIFTVIASIVLNRTRFGRQIMLVGSNQEAAKAAGLSLWTAKLASFTIASVTAGICGIFLAAQFSQGRVDQYPTLNMDVIAAVLMAGTSLAGGEGSALRTMLGTIFIALLSNLLLLTGQPYGVRVCVQGLFVILGVSGFHLLRRRAL